MRIEKQIAFLVYVQGRGSRPTRTRAVNVVISRKMTRKNTGLKNRQETELIYEVPLRFRETGDFGRDLKVADFSVVVAAGFSLMRQRISLQ